MVNVEDFLKEAETWEGTPWKANEAKKGIGVDCVRFPYAVAIASGINLVDPGNYSNTPQGEKLLERLDEQLNLIGVVKEAYDWSLRFVNSDAIRSKPELIKLIQLGDILVFSRSWRCPPGHLAIRTKAGKIHASRSKGVVESGLGSAKLLCAVYRFKEFC
ncbi:MAG: hypothetical protein AB4372_35665 [Xenococcus sp. (in: cyanobacteria)]